MTSSRTAMIRCVVLVLTAGTILAACASSSVPGSGAGSTTASTATSVAGSTPGSTGGSAAAPSTATPSHTGTAGSSANDGGGSAPTPDADEATQLVIILEAVNPGVRTDAGALVRTSVTICGHVLTGDPPARIRALTRQGFTNGPYVPSPAETDAMDMAITATFCR